MSDLTLITDDDNGSDKNIHRIEHSSVIAPGRYWRCVQDVKGIRVKDEKRKFLFKAGLMYLLTRLEFFEGKLHSVVLLDDPTVSTDTGLVTLDILLACFEQVSNESAKEFRDRQIADVQKTVADIQQEMAEAQTNPALLQPIIDKGLRQWERELARESGDEADPGKANLPTVTTNGQFNLSAAITHKIGTADIAVFRHMAQREGKIAEIRAKWLKERVEDMGRVLKQLTPFFSEQAAVAMAGAQDSIDLTKDIEKGLRSLNLYTGEGVEVNTLMSGKSAPANEPLTVYQRKLYVNEEFAVWADVEETFDYFHGSAKFFKALCENEGLRQQLIPAPRGVVAMATRIDDVKYGAESLAGIMENAGKNQVNKALFLLIRDGENWHQVWSAEPSHELSPRLFPTRNEMEQVFAGVDGETVGFEDLRFTKRANEYDSKSLAYKRFLILAAGLDRTKVFGHFYPENESLNFISMSFQKKYMRFVADDDSDVMLGDTVGDVSNFIRENKRQLAAGARVLVFGKEVLQQEAAPGAFSKGIYNPKLYKKEYAQIARPRHECDLLTVHRDKDDLVVFLPVRKNEKFDRYGNERPVANRYFEVRVALNKLDRLGSGLGYLLSDIIRADDLHPFIYNRRSRAHHVDYIYAFKRAIPVLKAEEDARAPVLAQLEDRAATHYGLSKDVAQKAVFSAIQTWREKGAGRNQLPALETPEFAKLDFELAESAFAFTRSIPAIRTFIEGLGGRPVSVKRAKKGVLVAYYEQPDTERDLRIKNWRWVGRRTFTPSGRPTKEAAQTVALSSGALIGEFELFGLESSYVDKFGRAGDLVKIQATLDITTKMAEVLADAFKGERQGVSDRAWLAFATPPASQEDKADVWLAGRDVVALPIGVRTETGNFLCVQAKLAELLYHYGSDAQRAVLLDRGFTVPKPIPLEDGGSRPYEGPRVILYYDEWSHLERYASLFHPNASSSHSDYVMYDHGYEGEHRINHNLGMVVSDGFKQDEDDIWRKKTVNPESLWFPERVRAATGEFLVSQMFPGLPAA